jgi:NDP-sugar pyrophosphorylase family protein
MIETGPATTREPPSLPPAWILAGGLATRLASVLPDRPKALAPIGDRPFLAIQLEQLYGLGFRRVLLLLGARHQAILDFLAQPGGPAESRADLSIGTSIEPEPLGTGGALKHAQAHAHAHEPFFLLNGDTYLDFDAQAMMRRHRSSGAVVTLAAVEQVDTSRFGRLDVTPEGFVRGFREKAASSGPGLINAGVYVMQPELLSLIVADRPVSLERELFPSLLAAGRKLAVAPQAGSFFDIGTPDDLRLFIEFSRSAPTRSATKEDRHD